MNEKQENQNAKPFYDILNRATRVRTVGMTNAQFDMYQELFQYVNELMEKVERYENALSFYANKDYYEPFREDEEDRTDAFNFIDLDGGETAREALPAGVFDERVGFVSYEEIKKVVDESYKKS